MSDGASRLAVLVHELRSPVAALVAIADAYPAADAERRARLVELAGGAVASIERLVGGGPLRRERVDMALLVREAVESAALSVSGCSIGCEVELGLYVDGDAAGLRQVLDNLIDNARGHSPPGGCVELTAIRSGATVVVEVADEGRGIAAADLERVFEPGVRLADDRPGSGLGLAVVRSIARAHGGEVEVESTQNVEATPGQGSTFRLVLPGASGAP